MKYKIIYFITRLYSEVYMNQMISRYKNKIKISVDFERCKEMEKFYYMKKLTDKNTFFKLYF